MASREMAGRKTGLKPNSYTFQAVAAWKQGPAHATALPPAT